MNIPRSSIGFDATPYLQRVNQHINEAIARQVETATERAVIAVMLKLGVDSLTLTHDDIVAAADQVLSVERENGATIFKIR